MKIKITEIEATAEDLRSNRTLSDALMDALDRCFRSSAAQECEEQEEESEDTE